MSRLKQFQDIKAMYTKHGWRLARVLLTEATRSEIGEAGVESAFGPGAAVVESDFDAMWFARGAQDGREAWELRLAGEPPFALFELFEADEEEEDREDVRREMEARMRERLAPPV